jgi:hypothetical protein
MVALHVGPVTSAALKHDVLPWMTPGLKVALLHAVALRHTAALLLGTVLRRGLAADSGPAVLLNIGVE